MFGEYGISQLWVEKYRPKTISDYIFKNESLKQVCLEWVKTGELPNAGIYGPAGTGKSSIIHVLINSIEKIDKGDVLELNMSDEGVDAIREKVLPFCQTRPFGAYKVVILEEFEQCSIKGQGSLKRIIEEYADTVRFLVTSNEPNKILPPIRSRLQEIKIDSHNYEEFTTRIINILLQENVNIQTDDDIALIDRYIKSTFPDFRKCINTLQQNCVGGKVIELNSSTSSTSNFEIQIANAILNNNLSLLRKEIVDNIREDAIPAFFMFLYNNTDIWIPDHIKNTPDEEFLVMQLLIKIKNGLVNDSLVACREINLSATLCELQMTVKEFI